MTRQERLEVLSNRNMLLAMKAQPQKYARLIDRMGGPDALQQQLNDVQIQFDQMIQPRQNTQAPTA